MTRSWCSRTSSVTRKKESTAVEAARTGTKEIGLAAVAATMSIAAVFLPVAYMKGMIGRFLFEFGVSVSVAILVSLFVALTLTPMLCSRMLRIKPKHGAVYEFLENGLRGLERGYARSLDVVLRHKIITLLVTSLVLIAVVVVLGPMIGAEFAPAEDMSLFMVQVEAPVGISLEAMDSTMQKVERIVLSEPEVRSGFMAIDMEERGQVNSGVMFCRLFKPDQREASQGEVVQRLRRQLAAVDNAQARVIEFSFYQVSSEGADFDLAYSLTGPDLAELDRISQRLAERLRAHDGFVDVDTNLDLEQPQLFVTVDRERAHDLGLDTATVFNTVYALIAGREVGSFTTDGKRYDVRMKVLERQARSADDIGALMVRSPSTGEMVRLDTVVKISLASGRSTSTGPIVNGQCC